MSESMESFSSVLGASPRRWLDLTATVPSELLDRPAVDGEWSAVDCLRHLLQADRHVFPSRVRQFLAGDEELAVVDASAIPPMPERTAHEMAESFARTREENLGLLATLRPEDLERTSRSRRFGPVTLSIVLHQWALHDLEHLMQAERALFQGLLPGAGPLRAFYAALDQERVEAPST